MSTLILNVGMILVALIDGDGADEGISRWECLIFIVDKCIDRIVNDDRDVVT